MKGSPAGRLAEAAAAAWAGLPLDRKQFRAELERRGAEGVTPERAADLYLAWGCAQGVPAAIAAFDARYSRELAAIAARTGIPRDTIDEAVQIIRVRLLVGVDGQPPRIAQFEGRSDLLAWLRISVLRSAFSLVKQARKAGSLEDLDLLAAPAIDADARLLVDRYSDDFRAAFGEALAAMSREDRAILRYRYLDGLTESQVAELLRVHRVTVARRMAAARKKLLSDTREALRGRLKVTTRELDSIMRAVQSQINITLKRVLATTPGVG